MSDKNLFHTDYLTANSFLIGMGTIFNLYGSYFKYNYSRTSQEADKIAIANDWHIVGQDIKNCVAEFEKGSQKQLVLPF